MNLQRYLETHADHYTNDRRSSSSRQWMHTQLLEDICSHLNLLGIQKGILYKEVCLLPPKKGIRKRRVKGCVDLIIFDNPDFFLIEAKTTSDSSSSRYSAKRKIRSQLLKAYAFFTYEFEVSARLIGVYREENAAEFCHYEILPSSEDILPFLPSA